LSSGGNEDSSGRYLTPVPLTFTYCAVTNVFRDEKVYHYQQTRVPLERRCMSKQDNGQHFTETHHALLFSWLSKALIEEVGEQRGKELVRKALRKYGEERGRRMALRAKGSGHDLDVANFFVYAEYRLVSGKMKAKVTEKSRNFTLEASRCPWCDAWNESGLLPYGRLYCLDIDEAVLRGFNPNLKMDIEGTLSNGAEKCKLVYREANLTMFSYLLLGYKRAITPGKKVVMPWKYHVGHLFKTFEISMIEDLGELGRKVSESALREFSKRYGESATQQVLAFRATDFTEIVN
jgi:predicted ArsR family transcriptional regulator